MKFGFRVNEWSRCRNPQRHLILIGAALLALALPTAAQPANASGGERSGKQVVDAVCAACHTKGASGAPQIGDSKAWGKRAAQGLTGLTRHALAGIRKMPAHGGNPAVSDLEISRAVTYMVNRSGGRWVEPASAKDLADERGGEQVVKGQCVSCHQTGVGGAPKIGDRQAWVARLSHGVDPLVRSAIRGHGGMPPRGGQANLTDAELRAAILYMYNPVAAPAARPRGTGAPVARADPNHKTVSGIDFYIGLVSAEVLRALPRDSAERAMHGGVPDGDGYYHINVTLHDAIRHEPINGAEVEVRIEQPGLGGVSKKLVPMEIGAASYGSYLQLQPHADYFITVHVRPQGSVQAVDAKFEHRTE
jgi:cytochrome c5